MEWAADMEVDVSCCDSQPPYCVAVTTVLRTAAPS